jgi:hypothetical protein
MKTASTRTRIAGFLFSIVMSTAVLGGTVLAMQSPHLSEGAQVIALENVTVVAPAAN